MSRGLVMKLMPMLLMVLIFSLAVASFPNPASIRDALGYVMTAQRVVLDGVYAYGIEPPQTPQKPNARVTPGWPMLLSGVYMVTGVDGTAESNAQRAHALTLFVLFLCSMGIVAATTLSGCSLGGDKLGMIAGIMAALYLPFSWASTVALAEQLGAVVLAWAIYVALVLTRPKHDTRVMTLAAVLGALCGLLLLTRANMAIWTLAPLAYVVVRRIYPVRQMLILAGIGLAAGLLVMAPWWARNAATLGRFIPLNSDYQPASTSTEPTQTTTPSQPASDDPIWVYTDLTGVIEREMLPWVPYFDVVQDSTWQQGLARIEYPQTTPVIPSAITNLLVTFTLWYHRVLVLLALGSLYFVRRSPRLLILLAAPLAILITHASTMTVRYLYPSMVAVVVMAAVSVYGVYMMATKKFASPA